MKIIPLSDRVLLLPIEQKEQEVKGGIIIPEAHRERPSHAKVVAVGEGRFDLYGKLVPMRVKVGDEVIMPHHGGASIKIDGKEMVVASEQDILGIVR